MKILPFGQAPPQVENDNLGTQFLNLKPGFLTLHPQGRVFKHRNKKPYFPNKIP
jgi:hypothetical protein